MLLSFLARGVVANFLCANYATVSLRSRCLYEKKDGFVTGCRDVSHLLDCGTYERTGDIHTDKRNTLQLLWLESSLFHKEFFNTKERMQRAHYKGTMTYRKQ